MTEKYRDEIVAAAQVAGAKVTKSHFFPRWQVNKFYRTGNIRVNLEGNKKYRVSVTNPITNKTESIFVSVPTAHKS
jgi:hypothetical protein